MIIQEGCDLLLKLFSDIKRNFIKIGCNVIEIDRYIGEFYSKNDCVSAPIKDYNFPGYSCISIGDIVTHGIPKDYNLKQGDVIKVDISFKYKDQHYFDSARTYVIEPNTSIKNTNYILMYNFNKYIVHYAINYLNKKLSNKEKVYYEDFGKVFYKLAEKSNYGIVGDYGGHRIQSDKLHEGFVPSLYDPRDRSYDLINEGDIFCIEPLVTERYSGINSEVYKINEWEVCTMHRHISTHYELMATLKNNKIVCLTEKNEIDL